MTAPDRPDDREQLRDRVMVLLDFPTSFDAPTFDAWKREMADRVLAVFAPLVDENTALRHQRDLLGDVLGRWLVATGLTADAPMTGPELLAHGETAVSFAADETAERDALRERERLAEVAELHRKSTFPASRGEHKGRHYCPSCTTSIDDFTAYVDWPCATARAALSPQEGTQ